MCIRDSLGFAGRVRSRLDAPQWLPAPAQGAIVIETRDNDPRTQSLCAALDHADTRTCVEAERAMNRSLHGSCHVPVAALARLKGGMLELQGLVGCVEDGRLVRAQASAVAGNADALGQHVARALLDGGAAEFLPHPE
jgi:hydroxymethylbilane synthase